MRGAGTLRDIRDVAFGGGEQEARAHLEPPRVRRRRGMNFQEVEGQTIIASQMIEVRGQRRWRRVSNLGLHLDDQPVNASLCQRWPTRGVIEMALTVKATADRQ